VTGLHGVAGIDAALETPIATEGKLPDAQRLSLLENVLETAHLGAIVLDSEHRIVLWNRWMERHCGIAASAALGADFFALFPDLQQKRVGSAIAQALRDNFPSLLSQTLNKAPFPLYANAVLRGERIQQAVAITPIDVAGTGRYCLIQINDVSNAVGREKLLRDQTMVLRTETFRDGLTGVANRRHFDMEMEKELRRAKRNAGALSLLMIDIDHFKSYNDHYGHQQGDACLIKVASTLASTLQRPGDLLARYGGEEFVAILPETGATHAMQMAETLRSKIQELNINHAHAGTAKHITVCIGIASQDIIAPVESGELIGAADRALYLAKHAGRNRVMAQSPRQIKPAAI
jgi:diguanylate cyclase (GGDEF)-like protein/PAS domain S-box-containing protein